jgi:hypothetical protein
MANLQVRLTHMLMIFAIAASAPSPARHRYDARSALFPRTPHRSQQNFEQAVMFFSDDDAAAFVEASVFDIGA